MPKSQNKALNCPSFRPKLQLDIDTSPVINPATKGKVSEEAYYLVFDTESFDAIEEEDDFSYSQSHSPVIALSWQVLNKEKRCLSEASYIIRRGGQMSDTAKAIHLITDEELHSGKEINEVMDLFISAVQSSPCLVAHNLDYHLGAIRSLFAECGLDDSPLNEKVYLCTMMKGLELGFKRRANGERLYPALDELFAYLYFGRRHIDLTYRSKTIRDIRLCSACLRRLSPIPLFGH